MSSKTVTTTAAVLIPDDAVGHGQNQDLLQPLQSLLQGINLLGQKTAADGRGEAQGGDPGAEVLESTATAVARIGAPIVAGLGGLTAIGSTIASFVSTAHDSVRIAALASGAAVIVAVVLGFAYIVSTDLRSRSQGSVAIYEARRAICVQYLDEVLAAWKRPGQSAPPVTNAAVNLSNGTAADTCHQNGSASASPTPTDAVIALAAAGKNAPVKRISDGADGVLAGIRCHDKIELRWIDTSGTGTWTDPADLSVNYTF
jgi:hypothetical protein